MRIEADHLVESLVGATSRSGGDVVYRDEAFQRSRLSASLGAAGRADVLVDRLVGAGVTLMFVSLRARRAADVVLSFRQGRAERDAWGRWLWLADRSVVLWLPRDPVVRRYDEHGRIAWAHAGSMQVEAREAGVAWIVTAESSEAEAACEFCCVRVDRDAAEFAAQVRSPGALETLPVSKARWLRYAGIVDIWQWLADGQIYKIYPPNSSQAYADQQLACTLYDMMTFLAEQTDKRVYRALAEWLAYAVLLSLPDDGLWRHGFVSDQMETHFRQQVDGGTLLLGHYQATGRDVFLEAAERVAGAVLRHAEALDDGRLWFLHDTLEHDWHAARQNYPRLFASTLMGKTVGNTLCLNTHIWALVLLHRLAAIQPAGPYDRAFAAGMETLKDVLEWAPAEWMYRRLYAGYDALARRAVNRPRSRTRKMARQYERLLKWILPKCKKRRPRLFMPNGFIERDLCATALSGGYHFVTLRDLAVLYAESRYPWLRPFIERAVQYSLRTRLAEFLAPADPRGAFLIDTLALCAYAVDAGYREPLGRLLANLPNTPLRLSPDVLALPVLRPWAREHAPWIVRLMRRDGDCTT